jgi:ThiF family protein/E2/UBC family protein C
VTLAPFFERIYGAIGSHLSVSRESLISLLDGVTVGIRCGDHLTSNDRWIAELTTNMMARLYPRLAISGPGNFSITLRELAARINPNIEFEERSENSATLCIGVQGSDGALYPSACGWVARLNHSYNEAIGPTNPYSAAAAAALGSAEIFRRVFLKKTLDPDVSVSLLDFSEASGSDLDLAGSSIGRVLFAGLGAVGNSAIWTLARHARLKGQVWLVDAEELTLLNLQRYVLGMLADVDRPKVLVAQDALLATDLVVEPFQLTLENFVQARELMDIETISISVDNVAGRRTAQSLLPRLVVNGWTGEQGLGSSWHIFSRDAACLACLYHPRGQGISATEQAARALGLSQDRANFLWVTRQPLSQEDIGAAAQSLGIAPEKLEPWRNKSLGDLYTDLVCGAMPLDVTGVGRLEMVPLVHQSVLAGVLMAAELVKRTNPELASLSQSECLVSWDDVLRPPPLLWPKPRAREVGCICGDADYQAVYESKWKVKVPRPCD